MTGRGGRGRGAGRRRGRGEQRNRARGHNYTGSSRLTKKGLCAALGANIFDYGHKAAPDEMQISWEKVLRTYKNQIKVNTVFFLAKFINEGRIFSR